MSTRKARTVRKEVWIGLAHVSQQGRRGALGEADQAYVNTLALAASRSAFRSQIKKALEDLDLALIRLEDAEPLKIRLSKYRLDEGLLKLADEVRSAGLPRFGTLHSFDV